MIEIHEDDVKFEAQREFEDKLMKIYGFRDHPSRYGEYRKYYYFPDKKNYDFTIFIGYVSKPRIGGLLGLEIFSANLIYNNEAKNKDKFRGIGNGLDRLLKKYKFEKVKYPTGSFFIVPFSQTEFVAGKYRVEVIEDYNKLLKFMQEIDKFIKFSLKDLSRPKGRM